MAGNRSTAERQVLLVERANVNSSAIDYRAVRESFWSYSSHDHDGGDVLGAE